MGLFDLFKGAAKKPAPKRNSPTYVMVKYCHLGRPQPYEGSSEYLYRWKAPKPPQIGMRVIAPTANGDEPAMVTHIGKRGDYHGQTEAITQLPAAADERRGAREWAKLQGQREKDLGKWLDLMRAEAGLGKKGWALSPPEGFPAPPPATGDAPQEIAEEYGRTWWRAFKNARDGEERKRFEQIAKHWYAVRDAAKAAATRASIEAGHEIKHWTDAFDLVTTLKREQRHEEALDVLRRCQESAIASDGGGLSPWPFEQAAIVLRKEKRLEDERAVILDYLQRADDPDKRMVDRLLKVNEKLGR